MFSQAGDDSAEGDDSAVAAFGDGDLGAPERRGGCTGVQRQPSAALATARVHASGTWSPKA